MGDYWFEQKRYGYGAGPPTTWQGWLLVLAFFAVLALGMWISFRDPAAVPWVVLGIATICVPFLLVARAKTRGGWRWRWGGDPPP